jgi:hypothetical protein
MRTRPEIYLRWASFDKYLDDHRLCIVDGCPGTALWVLYNHSEPLHYADLYCEIHRPEGRS